MSTQKSPRFAPEGSKLLTHQHHNQFGSEAQKKRSKILGLGIDGKPALHYS